MVVLLRAVSGNLLQAVWCAIECVVKGSHVGVLRQLVRKLTRRVFKWQLMHWQLAYLQDALNLLVLLYTLCTLSQKYVNLGVATAT